MTLFCQRSASSTFPPSYSFLFFPHHPSLPLFLFHSFCHQMSNFLSILPSKLIILSLTPPHLSPLTVSNTAYSHTIKHICKDTQHTHTSVLSSPFLSPSNLLSRSLTQSYFSMVAFVPFISAKTKDSCAHRTEGRRGLKGRTQRKRS